MGLQKIIIKHVVKDLKLHFLDILDISMVLLT